MWHAAVLHHYHLLRHEHQTNADATAVRPPLIADDMRTQTDQNPPAAERIAEENPRRLTDTTRLKLLDESKIRKRDRLKSSEQKDFWIFAPKNRYSFGPFLAQKCRGGIDTRQRNIRTKCNLPIQFHFLDRDGYLSKKAQFSSKNVRSC